MGRIKPKLVKRTSRQLVKVSGDSFDKTFDTNKQALRNTISSKKMRNKIAGYIARIKKNTKILTKDEQ
jgi:ribosomal protein S17E